MKNSSPSADAKQRNIPQPPISAQRQYINFDIPLWTEHPTTSINSQSQTYIPKCRRKTKHHARPRISAQRQFAKKKPWFTNTKSRLFCQSAQTQNIETPHTVLFLRNGNLQKKKHLFLIRKSQTYTLKIHTGLHFLQKRRRKTTQHPTTAHLCATAVYKIRHSSLN